MVLAFQSLPKKVLHQGPTIFMFNVATQIYPHFEHSSIIGSDN